VVESGYAVSSSKEIEIAQVLLFFIKFWFGARVEILAGTELLLLHLQSEAQAFLNFFIAAPTFWLCSE